MRKAQLERGKIAGRDFSWRTQGRVIAQRPRESKLEQSQLPATRTAGRSEHHVSIILLNQGGRNGFLWRTAE